MISAEQKLTALAVGAYITILYLAWREKRNEEE